MIKKLMLLCLVLVLVGCNGGIVDNTKSILCGELSVDGGEYVTIKGDIQTFIGGEVIVIPKNDCTVN